MRILKIIFAILVCISVAKNVPQHPVLDGAATEITKEYNGKKIKVRIYRTPMNSALSKRPQAK